MTAKLFAMLLDWRSSDSPIRRKHAAYRLSLPDAVNFDPAAGDAARAAALTAQFPPDLTVPLGRRCCGG